MKRRNPAAPSSASATSRSPYEPHAFWLIAFCCRPMGARLLPGTSRPWKVAHHFSCSFGLSAGWAHKTGQWHVPMRFVRPPGGDHKGASLPVTEVPGNARSPFGRKPFSSVGRATVARDLESLEGNPPLYPFFSLRASARRASGIAYTFAARRRASHPPTSPAIRAGSAILCNRTPEYSDNLSRIRLSAPWARRAQTHSFLADFFAGLVFSEEAVLGSVLVSPPPFPSPPVLPSEPTFPSPAPLSALADFL